MRLIIFTNSHFEEEKALVNLDTKEVIIKGDYYHDKIDERIEGYLAALQDFNIYKDEPKEKKIDSKHEMYEKLEFYNEDAEYEEEED